MPSLFDTLHKDTPNPLDNIEDILASNDWDFDRMNDQELVVTIAGKYCDYRLIFLWQPDMKGLQLCVQYGFEISPLNLHKAGKILMTLNERAWMGHFEISSDTCIPTFRYTYLFHNMSKNTHEDLENIVDIALAQCESNYAAFSLLTGDDAANDETLPLALMETVGAS